MTGWKDAVEKRLRDLESLIDQTAESSYPSRARLEDGRLRDSLDRVAKTWEVFPIDHSSTTLGTVTSVTMPTAEFDVADPTGAAVVTWDTQAENKVFAGPATPGAATPTFRLLVAADVPAHATTHQSGGSDSIKLDDLATPDDNTDLNASTTRHGLLKKLSNVSTEFLNGQGNFATPATTGGVSVTQITTTGDGTFAHPSGATWIAIDMIGGGGGGGGGSNSANGAGQSLGGTGAGGGARCQKVFRLADLPDPIPYHVGAGGAGGTGRAGSSAGVGVDGSAGESTTFGATTVAGAYAVAGGGGGGAGGSAAGSCGGGGGGGTGGPGLSQARATPVTDPIFGGPPNFGLPTLKQGSVGGEGGHGGRGATGGTLRAGWPAEWGGGGGGGSPDQSVQDGRGGTSLHGGGGGGSGGAWVTPALRDGNAGGASGSWVDYDSGTASGGGAGGTSGASPTAGAAGTAGTSAISGFGGGGGGTTSTNDTAGANGGAGGACGGGGGGGGGGKGTGAGGNGGAGGRGEIRIATW